jgi:hypothetical protein
LSGFSLIHLKRHKLQLPLPLHPPGLLLPQAVILGRKKLNHRGTQRTTEEECPL